MDGTLLLENPLPEGGYCSMVYYFILQAFLYVIVLSLNYVLHIGSISDNVRLFLCLLQLDCIKRNPRSGVRVYLRALDRLGLTV